MSELKKSAAEFIGYEYREAVVDASSVSLYLDCYRSFGWIADENIPTAMGGRRVTIHLKRDRKLAGRAELTRLQRHFESCVGELQALEKAKTAAATVRALAVGLLGTAFMAGATFAATHEPPVIWLCVVLAVPGFLGWGLPHFIYKRAVRRETARLAPLIETKREEADQICEKASRLL